MVPILESTVGEVMRYRSWHLWALNVRTNHIHAVVTAPLAPERVLTALKANCTRALAANGFVPEDQARVWSRHGSTRYLWNDDDVSAAVDYVLNRQGAPLG
jgi:REP element-mobilizing transposase RayT